MERRSDDKTAGRPAWRQVVRVRRGYSARAVRVSFDADRAAPSAYQPEPAIRLGGSAREAAQTRWGLVLVIFMRLLAGLWIVQGLVQWAGFMIPADAVFDHLTAARSAAVIFFSVLDLLAAVGLWLATPWGGVLWLFAALSQIVVAMMMPRFFTLLWVALDVVLVGLYFALTWRAAKAADL